MIFNSWQYMLFLPVMFILYWTIPHRLRWLVLLMGSYFFYAVWSLKYLLLLVCLSAATFFAAIYIERETKQRKKKTVFIAIIVICVGILFLFKYLNFFVENAEKAFSLLGVHFHIKSLQLLLPVGLSFYIFQMIAYITDVYNGKIHAEHHAGYYALFTSFFPQLLSGPINRAGSLIPQFHADRKPDEKMMTEGAKILLRGYFKKCVIADNLALFVDRVYGNLPSYRGFSLVLAAVFYSLQIYCDFSGYSDIAIGSARLFGIRLADNFRQPYLSASIREFWTRWHISLSQWFRDYIYIPLGGSRVKKTREYLNLLITFLISGLWHGASWTFVLWGAVHGIAQILEKLLTRNVNKKSGRVVKVLKTVFVFALVTLAWILFRAGSIEEAVYVFAHMLDGIHVPAKYFSDGMLSIVLGRKLLICMILFWFFPLAGYDIRQKRKESGEHPVMFPAAKWAFYAFLGLSILMFSPKGVASDFIYAQF